MGKHEQYYLQVTAGPSYDPATHEIVSVNAEKPVHITHENMDLDLTVRIRNYRGVPDGSPAVCDYFEDPVHAKDQYSIAWTFLPKQDIEGDSIIFGNDLDHPVRDKLPPGYKQAFKIMTWFIDTSLWGDPASDTPYMYGPALSSLNLLNIGSEKSDKLPEWAKGGFPEDTTAAEGIPKDASARKKYFLDEKKREEFVFEKGRPYSFDFFNPFLDFSEMAVKLPGFSLSVLNHWSDKDLEKEHRFRYVCKDRNTGTVYFVVVITLLKKENGTEGKLLTEDEQIEKGLAKRAPPQTGIIKYQSKPSGGTLVGSAGEVEDHGGEEGKGSSNREDEKEKDGKGGSNEAELAKNIEKVQLNDKPSSKGTAVEETNEDDVD